MAEDQILSKVPYAEEFEKLGVKLTKSLFELESYIFICEWTWPIKVDLLKWTYVMVPRGRHPSESYTRLLSC